MITRQIQENDGNDRTIRVDESAVLADLLKVGSGCLRKERSVVTSVYAQQII